MRLAWLRACALWLSIGTALVLPLFTTTHHPYHQQSKPINLSAVYCPNIYSYSLIRHGFEAIPRSIEQGMGNRRHPPLPARGFPDAAGNACPRTKRADARRVSSGGTVPAEGGPGEGARGDAHGSAPAPAVRIGGFDTWTNPDYTRLVLHVDGPLRWAEQADRANRPEREERSLRLRLFNARLEESLLSKLETDGGIYRRTWKSGIVRSVTFEPDADGLLMRLRLTGAARHRISLTSAPARLLIDFFVDVEAPVLEGDPLSSVVAEFERAEVEAGRALGLPGAAGRPFTIVLDPGHGGHDPGAVGPGGTYEKDVVLALSRRLARKLRRLSDVEVIMTRDEDVFVPLPERAEKANARGADLFISLHANASPHPDRRGVETYYLNAASDSTAAAIAQRENMSLEDSSDLDLILLDLTIEANARYSSLLASKVQASNMEGIEPLSPKTSDLGVKTAIFYVLVGARMPAILIETGFISNPEEERLLKRPRYQDVVAEAIKSGIVHYAASVRRASHAGQRLSP